LLSRSPLRLHFSSRSPGEADAQDNRLPTSGRERRRHGHPSVSAAVDSKGFFSVNGSDILAANDISFGLVMDYGHNIMRLEPGHGADALITHSFQGTFNFNYGIANLATSASRSPNLEGEAPSPTSAPPEVSTARRETSTRSRSARRAARQIPQSPASSAGSASRCSRKSDSPARTRAQKDLGADSLFFWPQLIAGETIFLHRSAEGRRETSAIVCTARRSRFDQLDGGPRFEYDNLVTGGRRRRLRISSRSTWLQDTPDTDRGGGSDSGVKLSDEVTGGIKVFVERNSYFMLGAGIRTTNGFEAADQRAIVGFIFEPSIRRSRCAYTIACCGETRRIRSNGGS